ncbi:MAG TPA: DUF1799 domain-containing protein [Noviherbaspirillum sp.]|nr:DUF1799 domain-containing protein [Noviherbaspirillum sp.]
MFGLTLDDVQEPVELWPENVRAVELFQRLSTQWRVGVGGATGLCYEAVIPLMNRMGLTDEEWSALFDDLQVLERVALEVMHEKS